MKILESAPRRYDRGLKLLSLGKIDKIKEKIAKEFVKDGEKVLEIGCGTGTLALMMAARGAFVVGFDVSKGMLEVAKEKVRASRAEESVKLEEKGVAEMDSFEDESFDKIVSTLVFSELSSDEQIYALEESKRILKHEGLLIIGDEVPPRTILRRVIHHLIRLPLAIITFILTQTITHPVKGLEEKIRKVGFEVVSCDRSFSESFEIIVAKKR
jgi:demethylmenaquinone methyltransferase/2-methoxy-6-polyprenyl-1,4-benzoquinol methylase